MWKLELNKAFFLYLLRVYSSYKQMFNLCAFELTELVSKGIVNFCSKHQIWHGCNMGFSISDKNASLKKFQDFEIYIIYIE